MTRKNHNLNIALEAARAGARVVLENFGKLNDSKVKANAKGLVTQTDLQAEEAILNVLRSKSEFNVLSEEKGWVGKNEGPVWIVDPLDGTNNFAHSLPFFAISVALMHNNDALLGVIIDPIHNMEYYAQKGQGAFCNGNNIKLQKRSGEYIPTLFLNHGYQAPDREKFKEITIRLGQDNNILKLGTTALELCFVASGSADAFICSGDEIWDYAAGMVIATEAGIIFTNWKGEKWDQNENHLLFAHPEIHRHLLLQINDLQ